MTIMKVINTINSPEIRNLVGTVVSMLPEYWFHIPASTSGKYHPEFSLGEGGLVRHSTLVAYFARRIALAQGMSDYWQDIITAAGLVHDGLKAGWNQEGLPVEELHTVHEHPVLMAEFLRTFGTQAAEDMAHVVESHMGQWTTSKYSDVVLSAPADEYQRVLSAADMVAATKELVMAPGFFD